VSSTYSYTKTGASGILMLKPGQSYEVAKISGIVYSLSITPTETPPAPKLAAPAPADTDKPANADAEAEAKQPEDATRRGPSEEDRKRYESLSDRAREKFREAMRELFSQVEFRNSPEEERRARIRKAWEEAEAEDQARSK